MSKTTRRTTNPSNSNETRSAKGRQRRRRSPSVAPKLAILESREQLRHIEPCMVPAGVVHTAELCIEEDKGWFVSVDGEHFVQAGADPSDWSPDRAADTIAGVGTCIIPLRFTRGFLKQWVASSGGWLEFNVIHHATNHTEICAHTEVTLLDQIAGE